VTPARIGTQHKTQTDRRPGKLPGRRIAFVAASALAGIAFGSGTLWPQAIAFADASPTIVQATVHEAAGGTLETSVSLAALVDNQTCPISPRAGQILLENGLQNQQVPVQLPQDTWSLATVLQCMPQPISPSAVTSIDVTGQDGTAEDTDQYSTVTGADLGNPSLTPVVSYGGSSADGVNDVQYDRPPHDASDLDFLDQFHSQSQPIQIFVYEGPSLNVTATASPSGEVTPGTAVTFNASVSPDDSANDPTYQWTFGDPANPTTATGATATTTYTTAGLWNAKVRVTDDTGASGTALVSIQVGSVPTTTNPNQTGTTPQGTSSTPSTPSPVTPPGPTKPPHHKHHPTGAPSSGKPGAPKHQHASGGSGGGKTPTKTNQTQTQTQPTSNTTTPQSTTSPTVPPQQTGGSSGSGDGSGTAGGSGAGGGPAAGQQTATTPGPSSSLHPTTTPLKAPPTTRRHDRAPAPAGGRRVVGYTLSSVQTVPPGSSPLVTGAPVADRGPTANRHADAGDSPLAIVLSALVVLLLLCLGAGRELRQSIDWHTLLARLRRD
jgi:hypothetical protein